MGEMLAMPTDPIADACADAYEGEGIFVEGGWATIPRAVATDLIPGEDFSQFMAEMLPTDSPDVAIDLDRLERVRTVELCRERVAVLVAPAVLSAAQQALEDHWVVDELVAAVQNIAEEYRPRVRRLAETANTEEMLTEEEKP